jgi:prepilin-type N-terminal cleavage/methylation domain-containing protein
MKKKGFTLVELLAVIAILAILVIIALPNVLGMFNDAKKSTFNTEVQSIFKQAQTDFVQDSIKSAGPQTYCTAKYCATENKLNLETTKDYYVSLDASGNVLNVVVSDASFAYGIIGSASDPIKVNDIAEDDVKGIGDVTLPDKDNVSSFTTITTD